MPYFTIVWMVLAIETGTVTHAPGARVWMPCLGRTREQSQNRPIIIIGLQR